MSLPTPVIAGNWKMHHGPGRPRRFFERLPLARPGAADRGGRSSSSRRPSRCPRRRRRWRGARTCSVGVQNVYWEAKGAFTGEVSAGMAAEAGARLALVGHSERRQHLRRDRGGHRAEDARRASRAGLLPAALRRRDAGGARGGPGRRGGRGAARARCTTASTAESAVRIAGRLRAGVGDRHRPHRLPAGRGGDARRASATFLRGQLRRRGGAARCRSSTAGA